MLQFILLQHLFYLIAQVTTTLYQNDCSQFTVIEIKAFTLTKERIDGGMAQLVRTSVCDWQTFPKV